MNKIGAFAVLAGTACGGSHSAPPDAAKQGLDAPVAIDAPRVDAPRAIDAPPDASSPFDFSCAGSALGSAAADVTIGGTAETLSVSGTTPLPDVLLQLRDGSDNHVLATTGPTGSDGTWAFAAEATNGSALDVYIAGSDGTADRPSFIYPPRPLVANATAVPFPMFSQAELAELTEVGLPAEQAGDGLLFVQVEDCNGTLVAGSTLVVEQNGSAISGSDVFDVGQLSSSFAGTFIVVNLPPGGVTVGATFQTTTLASHVVTSFANGDTGTQVLP